MPGHFSASNVKLMGALPLLPKKNLLRPLLLINRNLTIWFIYNKFPTKCSKVKNDSF
jgi:hypothetical protein